MNYKKPPAKKGKVLKQNPTPNHITIFVAQNYPKWQEITLNYLKESYNPDTEAKFPANPAILAHLKTNPDIKPFMKKLMPFVAFVKAQVAEKGTSVLESHLSFGEMDVFLGSKEYLLRSLDLDNLEIVETSTYPDQKLVADVCPGKPLCKFELRELDPLEKPSVRVSLVNVQPCTPFFKHDMSVYDTDTVEDIISRLKRADRRLKYKQVEVYQYVDPVKGPRQMLAFDQSMFWNKRKMEGGVKFEKGSEGLKAGKNLVGDTLCYVVS